MLLLLLHITQYVKDLFSSAAAIKMQVHLQAQQHWHKMHRWMIWMLCWIRARDSAPHSMDFSWEDGGSVTDFGFVLDQSPSLEVETACPKSQTGLWTGL